MPKLKRYDMKKKVYNAQKARDSLLGVKHRIISFGHDGVVRNYFARHEDNHLEIIDTHSGKRIIDGVARNASDNTDNTYIIHRLSENIHIVGIYDGKGINRNKPDSDWHKRIGFDSEAIPIPQSESDALYNALYFCCYDKAYKISQFAAKENILTVDLMAAGMVMSVKSPYLSYQAYSRRLVKITDGTTLYESGLCRYSHTKIARGSPPAICFDDGVLVLSEEVRNQLDQSKSFSYFEKLRGKITIYNFKGEVSYDGLGEVDVGQNRLFFMEYSNSSIKSDFLSITSIDEHDRRTGTIHKSYTTNAEVTQ